MTSSSRRDTMSSWNSCSFSTPQKREKKQIARDEVRSSIKIHHNVWLACETRAKILLSDPETSPTTPCLLSLKRSRRYVETTNRPSHPDRLEIVCHDWDDRDDHMETRL